MIVNQFKNFFISLRAHRIFNIMVVSVIIASAIYAGASTYDLPDSYVAAFQFFDYAITLFFLTEIIIRLLSEKHMFNFFKNGWNVFDFIIVTISLIPVSGNETAFVARLLRVIRILRIITLFPDLRKIIDSFFESIPKVFSVVLLMFILFYIWAAIGSILFEDVDSTRWGNIGKAMLVLLQIITYDDWASIMGDVMSIYPLSWIYFVSFLIINGFILFNMIIGVLIEVMAKHYQNNKEK